MRQDEFLGTCLASPSEALQLARKIRCERSLHDFLRHGWHVLEPGVPYVDGWCVGAICEHLEAVSSGQIKRLLINVPPGCTKSMTVSVYWPAWEWGPRHEPHHRYITASYGGDLSMRDNVRCRDLVESEWYRERWGEDFELKADQNAKGLYKNTAEGWRFAASVGKGITGHRGSRIIIDDPHNVQDVESDAKREEALRWYSETLPTRVQDQENTPFIVIMQRVHERDISGHVLAKELGYEHLCLPMEFEPEHPHLSKTSLGFVDPRTQLGELLWPERFSAKAVQSLKTDFRSWGGTFAESGQLQQRPSPRGGGLFQRKDWQYVDEAPSKAKRVRGWDLAATDNKRAAFTAGVKMSIDRQKNVYIEDVRRGQKTPGQVERLLEQTAESDGSQVEQSLPQDPGQAGKSQRAALAKLLHGYRVHFSPETGSKETRAGPLAAQAEAGNLYIVRGPWNDAFTTEAEMFPQGQFKDQIDAASRAYGRLLVARKPVVGAAPRLA